MSAAERSTRQQSLSVMLLTGMHTSPVHVSLWSFMQDVRAKAILFFSFLDSHARHLPNSLLQLSDPTSLSLCEETEVNPHDRFELLQLLASLFGAREIKYREQFILRPHD